VKCVRCKKKFKPADPVQTLCQKCIDELPRCWACGIVVAPQYGWPDSSCTKVGEHELCGSCYMDLRRAGFLYLGGIRSGKKFMLLDGTTVVISVKQADRFFEERFSGKCKSLTKFLKRRKLLESIDIK